MGGSVLKLSRALLRKKKVLACMGGLSLSPDDLFLEDVVELAEATPSRFHSASSLEMLSSLTPVSPQLHCCAESFGQMRLWASPPEDAERSIAATRRAELCDAGRRAADQLAHASPDGVGTMRQQMILDVERAQYSTEAAARKATSEFLREMTAASDTLRRDMVQRRADEAKTKAAQEAAEAQRKAEAEAATKVRTGR